MKHLRLLFVMSLLVALGAFGGFSGCSDDDEGALDSVLTEGSVNDTSFLFFMQEMGDIHEVSENMLAMSFFLLDSVVTAAYGPDTAANGDFFDSLNYAGTSKYWRGYLQDIDDGDTFTFVDSIQLRHGTTAVQWPNLDSLTQIVGHCNLHVTGPDITTGQASQDITITQNATGDTLLLDGLSGIVVEHEFDEVNGSDSVHIEANNQISVSVNDLAFDTDSLFSPYGSLNEPLSGTMVYVCDMNMTETGTETASCAGRWTLTLTFEEGDNTLVIVHDNVIWTDPNL